MPPILQEPTHGLMLVWPACRQPKPRSPGPDRVQCKSSSQSGHQQRPCDSLQARPCRPDLQGSSTAPPALPRMHKALAVVQHSRPAATSHFFTCARAGFAGTAGGGHSAARRGQGFGPRPARGARLPGVPATAGGRRPAAAAAARDPRARAGQQPTLVTQQQPGDGGEGGGGQGTEQATGDGAMHGQQTFKAGGLPSSRSDTMLLQSAEQQQRYGLPPTGGRGPMSAGSSPAVGAAAGMGPAGQGSTPPGANSIPVYVMLPLDTVRGPCSLCCWACRLLARWRLPAGVGWHAGLTLPCLPPRERRSTRTACSDMLSPSGSLRRCSAWLPPASAGWRSTSGCVRLLLPCPPLCCCSRRCRACPNMPLLLR